MAGSRATDVSQSYRIDSTNDVGSFVSFMDRMRSWPLMSEQKARSIAEMRLFEGAAALDVGSGTGEEVVTMAKLVGSAGRAVGVDASHEMLKEAQRRFGELDLPIELLHGSIYELPFDTASFDATRAERLFEHLEHGKAALRELIRVTRPGGRVVAVSPDGDLNAFDVPGRALARKLAYAYTDRMMNGHAGRQLYSMFHDAGLDQLTIVPFTHVFVNPTDTCDVVNTRIDIAFAAGCMDENEREQAHDCVAQAGEQGRLFFATTHFLVAGTVP